MNSYPEYTEILNIHKCRSLFALGRNKDIIKEYSSYTSMEIVLLVSRSYLALGKKS